MVKKTVVFTLVGTLVGLYTTFVLQHLWNWFVTTAFHLPEISFWVLYGVVLSIGMFSDTQSSNFQQRQWFKGLATGLDACIPESKYESVKEQMDAQGAEMWVEAGFLVFGRLLASTVTLIIGGAVHLFLA
jgi:hypothetical protein